MFRRTAAALLGVSLTLLASPAHAGPPTTDTITRHGFVETFVDVIPSCEPDGPLYTITTTANGVEHQTLFDDGRKHTTFTETGTFSAVPLDDKSLPSYTGKFTVWGDFNENGSTVEGSFTFNVRGTGSDGSSFANHDNEHFNVRPDGTVHEFFHCR